jgi:hypothetical protein
MNRSEELSDESVLREARRYSGVRWIEPDPDAWEDNPVKLNRRRIRRRMGCANDDLFVGPDQTLGSLSTIFE